MRRSPLLLILAVLVPVALLAAGIYLGGHPGRVDAIGVLAGAGFDASRLQAVAGGAQVDRKSTRLNSSH